MITILLLLACSTVDPGKASAQAKTYLTELYPVHHGPVCLPEAQNGWIRCSYSVDTPEGPKSGEILCKDSGCTSGAPLSSMPTGSSHTDDYLFWLMMANHGFSGSYSDYSRSNSRPYYSSSHTPTVTDRTYYSTQVKPTVSKSLTISKPTTAKTVGSSTAKPTVKPSITTTKPVKTSGFRTGTKKVGR